MVAARFEPGGPVGWRGMQHADSKLVGFVQKYLHIMILEPTVEDYWLQAWLPENLDEPPRQGTPRR